MEGRTGITARPTLCSHRALLLYGLRRRVALIYENTSMHLYSGGQAKELLLNWGDIVCLPQ